jgi:hypothetical protein
MDLETFCRTLEAREKKINNFFIPSTQNVDCSKLPQALKNAKRLLQQREEMRAIRQLELQIEQEKDALRQDEQELQNLKFTKL